MKTIVCYGDSNTWGALPLSQDASLEVIARFPYDVRWVGVLARLLGSDYRVIDEGINGRTTAFHDVNGPYRNGAKYLGMTLMSTKPVDLLIFMLGVNDTKEYMKNSVKQIGHGIEKLVKTARSGGYGADGGKPKILIISPALIREEILTSIISEDFSKSSIKKSQALAGLYSEIAKKLDCYFLDAADFGETSPIDGIHLDPKNHEKLAKAVVEKITEIFAEC